MRTPSDPGASRAFLRERLSWPEPLPEIAAEKVGQETNGPWSAEFWLFEPELGIRLPAVPIVATGATAPLTLIPGQNKRAVAHHPAGRPTGPRVRPAGHGRDRRGPRKCAELGLARRSARKAKTCTATPDRSPLVLG